MALATTGQTGYETTRHEVMVGGDDRRTWFGNHASLGAVVAGVIAAVLTQMVLGLAGVGLGLASFQITGDTGANPSVGGMSTAAAVWWIGSGIVASLVGGIVAGRLCGSARHSTAAWHGFIAWCATTLVVVWMLGSALGGVLGGTMSAIGGTVSGLGKGAMAAAGVTGASADPNALQAQVQRLVKPDDTQNAQDAILKYVRASVGGDQKAADDAKQGAVDALAKTANISPEDAQKRLDGLQQQAQQAAQQAKDAAEQARKAAAEGSLFAVAALLFGMIAAIIGGGLGAPRPSSVVVD